RVNQHAAKAISQDLGNTTHSASHNRNAQVKRLEQDHRQSLMIRAEDKEIKGSQNVVNIVSMTQEENSITQTAGRDQLLQPRAFPAFARDYESSFWKSGRHQPGSRQKQVQAFDRLESPGVAQYKTACRNSEIPFGLVYTQARMNALEVQAVPYDDDLPGTDVSYQIPPQLGAHADNAIGGKPGHTPVN